MTFEIFINGVPAVTIEYTKRASQVPQGESPSCFLPQRKAVFHPGQSNGVRRSVVNTPLAYVHLNGSLQEWLIFIYVFSFETLPVPDLSLVIFQRPSRRIQSLEFISRYPGGGVMAYCLWQIPSCTLHQSQVQDLTDRRLSDVHA